MILIIDKKTLQIVSRYEGSRSRQNKYGGEWGDPELFDHVLFEGDVVESVNAVRRNGRIELETDTSERDRILAERQARIDLAADQTAARALLRSHYERPQTPPHEKAMILLILGERLTIDPTGG